MANETAEDILHSYLVLHEHLAEEREELTKRNVELTKLITRLRVQINKLQESEQELKQQVSRSMNSAASEMASKTAEQFKREVMQDVKSSTEQLWSAARNARSYAEEIRYKHFFDNIYWAIGIFLVPIIVSLLIYWQLSPTPMKPLTDQQFVTYQNGQMLNSFWSKLNKRQKAFLTKLADGKINNRGRDLAQMAASDDDDE